MEIFNTRFILVFHFKYFLAWLLVLPWYFLFDWVASMPNGKIYAPCFWILFLLVLALPGIMPFLFMRIEKPSFTILFNSLRATNVPIFRHRLAPVFMVVNQECLAILPSTYAALKAWMDGPDGWQQLAQEGKGKFFPWSELALVRFRAGSEKVRFDFFSLPAESEEDPEAIMTAIPAFSSSPLTVEYQTRVGLNPSPHLVTLFVLMLVPIFLILVEAGVVTPGQLAKANLKGAREVELFFLFLNWILQVFPQSANIPLATAFLVLIIWLIYKAGTQQIEEASIKPSHLADAPESVPTL